MAYRELCVVEVVEILRLWVKGRGIRTVATWTGVDRKTVRRYVETAQALGLSRDAEGRAVDDALVADVVSVVRPGTGREVGSMRQHCRVHADLIRDWLGEGCRGPKVVKLLARHTGVVVPLRTLQRFVAEELRAEVGGTVPIVGWNAGEILEIDFLELGFFVEGGTGRRRKMHALLCTAPYSRHQFVWPCLTQTQQDVIEGLEAAWAFFGGVFTVVVSDNLKAAVDTPDPMGAKLNATFTEYAQSRDFEVDAARVRKPKDKARVERQVRYVRDDFFAGERFVTVEEARVAAERWCREDAGLRTHGRTRQRPREVFERDERPLLKPAPTEPYDEPEWSSAKVGRDHTVTVDYALYSVPYTLGEVRLRIRRDRATVKLYRAQRLVKVHPRKRRGEASIDPADLPPGKAEFVMRDGQAFQRKAAHYGPHVAEYVRRLLDTPLPWTRMRQVYRLLGLANRYGGALVEEACTQSLALDVVDVVRIDRMLEKGLLVGGKLSPPRPPTSSNNVIALRFARDPDEWRSRNSQPPGDAPDAPT
jgi:hypothetical protein